MIQTHLRITEKQVHHSRRHQRLGQSDLSIGITVLMGPSMLGFQEKTSMWCCMKSMWAVPSIVTVVFIFSVCNIPVPN